MFRFESASYFNLLILVPVFVALTVLFAKISRRRLFKQMGERIALKLSQSVSVGKRRWKIFLQALCLLLMIVALARPQQGESQEKIKSEGIEVFFAVDVSESMLAEDVKPSRLEQAKIEMSRLVDLSPGNKVGVIAFAGGAAVLCPLTNDPNAVKMYIDSLSTNSVSSQGTNFQAALAEAREGFERGGASNDDTSRATRVILIASDGEDHEQGALDEAKKLSDAGVKIFTLAYGTEKGAGIPERDGLGYMKGFKRDHSGNPIVSTVKGDFLKNLAGAGGGSFYFAVFGGSHLNNLVEDFSKLEKKLFDSQVTTLYEEKFQWVLFLAFLIGLLELQLGERKTGFQLWRGRFEVSQ